MKNILTVLMAIAAVAMIYMMFMNNMIFIDNAVAWDSIRDPNPPTYGSRQDGPIYPPTPPWESKAIPPQQYAPQWRTPLYSQRGTFCTTNQIGQTVLTYCW